MNSAIETVVAYFGALDILVNNAGIGAVGDISANDDEEWHRVLDVNVVGLARMTGAALPHLRKSDHAAIVNTCSLVTVVGLPNRALYAASKGAVASVTLAMAADHVRKGIRVNTVTPGTADTPRVARPLDAADDPDAAAAALRARQPMGRLVTAGSRTRSSTSRRRAPPRPGHAARRRLGHRGSAAVVGGIPTSGVEVEDHEPLGELADDGGDGKVRRMRQVRVPRARLRT